MALSRLDLVGRARGWREKVTKYRQPRVKEHPAPHPSGDASQRDQEDTEVTMKTPPVDGACQPG